ncbi:eukaryotic initiation factor 4a-10 [Trifolium pratense]|uniref:RNA helicase n=1 Tax=Trifolium pratense TaxID=57577 RepID=A0A2K3L2R2_TRIPR|nr:eukaryotic initiation factor 4a-10 [Trifolium pratense]
MTVSFGKPSSIQQRGIVPFCKGLDVILHAPSGTGKSATFCIGILQKLDYGLVQCQALVLAPTSELALHIQKIMQDLGKFLGVKVHACFGGTSVRRDQRILQNGVHTVVGTPGRVYDMLQRRALRLRPDGIKMFVLDELDEMLSHGFKDKIHEIFELLPSEIQVGVISAAMPPEALKIITKFMKKPVLIQERRDEPVKKVEEKRDEPVRVQEKRGEPVRIQENCDEPVRVQEKRVRVQEKRDEPVRDQEKRDELTLEGIKQFYVNVEKEEWKLETLSYFYETLSTTRCIVFVNTERKMDWLTDKMRSKNHTVSAIHGDMDQNTRDIIVREFQSGSPQILITTEPLVPGIDVQEVSLVVNYELPTLPENYVHRIGRGGRFGRKSVAINFVTLDDARMLGRGGRFGRKSVTINFVTLDDARMLADIQKFYNVSMEKVPSNVADLLS